MPPAKRSGRRDWPKEAERVEPPRETPESDPRRPGEPDYPRDRRDAPDFRRKQRNPYQSRGGAPAAGGAGWRAASLFGG